MPHRPGHRNINRATTSRVPNRNRQRITNSTIVDGNDRPVINRTTTGTSVSFNGPGGGVNIMMIEAIEGNFELPSFTILV